MLICSLHTQAAMVGDEFTRSNFVATFIRFRFCAPSLHPVDRPKSRHQCRMSISTNLRNPGAMIFQVSHTMPSSESSREPVAAGVPHVQLGSMFQRSPLFCLCRSLVVLSLPCVGLVQSRTGSWGSTNIPYSSGLSSHSVPTNNVLARIRILTPVLTVASFLSVLPVTFPFLAFLAALLVAFTTAVHIHWT